MEPVKNVQRQTTTTRSTRTCTRALVTLSSYPGSPGPGLCTTPFILRATQRQRCCHDGGVLPYMIRIACSLSSRLMAALFGAAATAGAAGAADSSTPAGASSPSSLLWSSASGSTTAPLARCRWLGFLHLAREAPLLCLVETVLPSPEGVLLLREAHAAPPRSSR